MATNERDDTEDWVLDPASRPATLSDLEARIDYAIAVALASERAALEIGSAALESAEQAQRAADLAARASGAAAEGSPRANPPDTARGGPASPAGLPATAANDDHLARFMLRAERVGARLAILQQGELVAG